MAVRFYYDIVCPFAYVAFTQIGDLAREAGVEVQYKPILLGGVLQSVGSPTEPMLVMNANKLRITERDAYRQAERAGVSCTYPDSHPIRTVNAMRLLLAVDEARRPALSADLYRAYWVEGRDVADLEVLAAIASPYGLDVDAVCADPDIRQALFDASAEAVALGAFGVPTIAVGDTFFWGADRLHLVREALGLPPRSIPTGETGHHLAFFHDFSSPFSYLGSTQVERIAAERGATLEYVPFLLGALFQSIGTPMVPLESFAKPRQDYQRRDLRDWAAWWGVPFQFASQFPLRTVAALRVAIQNPETTPHLYRAAWVHDRNIGDPEVLRGVLDAAGFDGEALLRGAQDPAIKARLRRNTERAEAVGACGAPSFLVDDRILFWGQDRVGMVEAALAGWSPARG